ncbi:iron complex transport system substrate-binding protein [Flavimobilis soli]|uniref:Iron complex transport system substrate-binding protein n=1 Tax=Flavimobilis soli TaxID=442709 RepID=A0A2A9EFV7_9MICO|nr:iron-siderophore ABC transporter substrate-binding protein [Flavimobilis soli]PFG37109.1 iron complex transport system substrate-binding protein [Flavimobilis soli]
MRTTFSGALRPAAAVAAALTLATLAACSTDTPAGTTTSSTSPAASTSFPVTIEHAFGETVVEKEPQRVAAISWANQDAIIALGVTPAAMPFASYGGDADGYLPWTRPALEALGGEAPALLDEGDTLDFEALAAAAPDLIVGAYSGITDEDYDKLTKIAPTIAYPEVAWGTSWRDQLTMTGKALGKEAEAEQVTKDIEAKLASALDDAPELEGKTFAYLWFNSSDPSTITYYTTADARVAFVESLGLKSSAKIAELSGSNDQFFGTISAELADEIDADVVLAYVDSKEHLEAVKADKLLGKIPAIASGAVIALDDPTFILSTSAPSPLSVPWAVDQYVPAIKDALESAK